jgi:hypothetical protein
MSLKSKLRSIVFCSVLLAGVFGGVPMRPEEIEELMRCVNQPKIEYTIQKEDDDGEPPGG